MTLREAILESYNNAADNGDLATISDLDSMSPAEFAEDLFCKSGVIEEGHWTVEEITAEIVAMREEGCFGR